MSKFSTIKRATVGNLIKADAAGDSNWVVGRITASDTKKGTISYQPADGTDEITIKRDYAFKATQAEYDAQLPAGVAPNAVAAPLTADEWEKMTTPPKRDTEEVVLTAAEKAPRNLRKVHTSASGKKWTSDGSDLTEAELAEDDDEKENPLSRIKDYLDNYEVVIAASGKKSRDAGDAVAKELRGLTLNDTYARVASITGSSKNELIDKYAHLNEGQQRMVLGNRLRGHYRRAAKLEEEEKLKQGE